MPLGTSTPTLIHQGPGLVYLNVCAPASGKRHIIGADGTPSQPGWPAAQAVTPGQMIVDSNGNVQECTVRVLIQFHECCYPVLHRLARDLPHSSLMILTVHHGSVTLLGGNQFFHT